MMPKAINAGIGRIKSRFMVPPMITMFPQYPDSFASATMFFYASGLGFPHLKHRFPFQTTEPHSQRS